MKTSAALSLLFLLSNIRAAAVPKLIGSELESTSSSLKRDSSGNLTPRSPQPESSELDAYMTDDPSLVPSSDLKQDLSARSPQGPDSNPGEFIDIGVSRANPGNHHSSADSSFSSSTENGQENDTVMAGSKDSDPSPVDGVSRKSHDRHRPPMMEDGDKFEHHRHYNDSRHHHNGSHHHDWNGTHHGHRKDGILAEYNFPGEHVVVYNGTHYPNGTKYSPANETRDGGELLGEFVASGDEVVVYRQPWNESRHHHHHHHYNYSVLLGPTATGAWLPSGTGWIPSGTGRPRHHRKVPSAAFAGFRGPRAKRNGGKQGQ